MNWYTFLKLAHEENSYEARTSELRHISLRGMKKSVPIVDVFVLSKGKDTQQSIAMGANGKWYETHPKGNWRRIKDPKRLSEAQELLGRDAFDEFWNIKEENTKVSILKTANELKRTSRKTLERLGIPFTEEVVRWKEYQGKYSPIKRLIVKDEDISPYLEWQEETKDKRKKNKERKEEERRREKETSTLHEDTDYKLLRDMGWSEEDAIEYVENRLRH
jgi:hypothetical protein